MKLYLLIITFFFALSAQALDSIPVYSPDSPPYAINMEKGEGMLFDFVNSLNEQFKGKCYFTANFVTRARLKVIFAKKENTMIVPFVNPHWFDDELEKKYFWTLSMAEDCNVIVVKKNKISKIKKWNDLQGMSTSILNGQVNTGVQKIMDQMKIKVEGAMAC